ncbi:MAG TPA: DUF1579 domain-containing protein [Candidatus Polarisedimenticolia bacterium]|nr:DUF1579 domain-containing protein [Candidatus Polarisedimenticolia bacterium]
MAFAGVVVVAAAGAAEQPKPASQAQGAPQKGAPPEMVPPRPVAQHQQLAKRVGTWDAVVEMYMAPGAPPQTSKGSETNTMDASGLWLLTEFKGQMMDQPFEGHGLTGFDTARNKYVGVWVDSYGTHMMTMEGTGDAAGKMTMVGQSPGMDGKPERLTIVTEPKSDGTYVMSMSRRGADGKDVLGMRITYSKHV